MRNKIIAVLLLCALFITIGCDKKLNRTEGTSDLLGVSMYAEKNKYPSNVNEINVIWQNDTDKELTFGESFSLQKLTEQDWIVIGKEEMVFNSIGYIVRPNSKVKHSYNIRLCSDKLEAGTYRIVTNFLEVHSPGNYDTYNLTTSFTVTK